MIKRIGRYLLLVVVLAAAVVIVDALRVKLPIGLPGAPVGGEITGAIHVHTMASDGGGSIDDVVSAAKWADLSFVAITDHNAALAADVAGTDRSHVLLVGGEEVSSPSGHFLALGVTPGWRAGVPKKTAPLLEAAKRANAAVFVAHPFGTRRDWEDWETTDFDGMEIWNGDAEWRDNNLLELLMSALIYTVNPDLAMVRLADRPEAALAKWDELLATRRVAGICGADAHARVPIAFGRSVGFPAYLRVFRLARQHVFLPYGSEIDPAARSADAVVRALKEGRSYCAIDGLAIASGFVHRIESGERSAGPGEAIAWTKGSRLRVSISPAGGRPRIRVYKDGIETFDRRGWRLDAELPGPGVYRTEVWLRQPGITGGQRWSPWILSNPIYVTDGPPR